MELIALVLTAKLATNKKIQTKTQKLPHNKLTTVSIRCEHKQDRNRQKTKKSG